MIDHIMAERMEYENRFLERISMAVANGVAGAMSGNYQPIFVEDRKKQIEKRDRESQLKELNSLKEIFK